MAEARRAALAHAEPLIAQIAGFSARAQHLAGAREQRDLASRKRAQAEKARADLRDQHDRLEDERARSEASRAGRHAACEAAEASLRALLGGALSVKARREARSDEARARTSRAASGREARILTLDFALKSGRIVALDDELAALSQRGVALDDDDAARALALREPLAIAVTTSAERFGDFELFRRFADARRDLDPGKECPLCGSREHPLVGEPGRDDERAEIDRRFEVVNLAREQARAALAEHDQAIHARRADRAGVTISLAEKARQRAELAPQADEIRERATARLDDAGLAAGASVAEIDALLAELSALDGAARAEQSALDDAEETLKTAVETRRIALDEIAKQKAELGTIDARLDAATVAATEHAEAVATLDAQMAEAITTLRADLAQCAVAVREPGGAIELDAAIHEARALTQAARAAIEEHRLADAAELGARGAHDRVAGQHAQAAARAVEHEGAAAERRSQASDAQREMEASLSGADPDALERSLKVEADATQRALDAANQRATSGREELARITTRREEAESQHATAQARAEKARAALAHHLIALALPDERALAERLLGDEQRARLTEETSRAREALAAATTTRESAEKKLAATTATRPEGAGPDESTSADLAARQKALSSRRGELHQQLGRCREQLDDHRRKTRDLASVLEQIDRARRDHDIWQSLHNLIGVGDGERFKLFAQILNLQELIDTANARLKWLAPRYSLTIATDDKGNPRLSFYVRDAQLADAERPLTTLSGGETFLVSLALALALADYRAVEMPIETLLLDEGFGTLDTDTLNTAMDALERLQARGTQIGIISHLGGLRERIEARIVVDKVGNGRSEIRFELGVDV